MGKAVIGALIVTATILLAFELFGPGKAELVAAQSGTPAEVELLLGYQERTNRSEAERFVTSLGLNVRRTILGGTVLVVRTTPASPTDVVEQLQTSGYFAYVEESHRVTIPQPVASSTTLPPLVGTRAAVDDPRYEDQWYLHKISAAQAWDITMGSADAKVCVADSGFDVGHEDQPANLVLSLDYVAGGNVQSDPHGHGTHVTGIIAARTNNGKGIASLAPGVQVVSMRVLDELNIGYDWQFAEALYHGATTEGCRVINLSLGGPMPSQTFKAAVDYAIAQGVLVVAASGNCGVVSPACPIANPPSYPAMYPGVMAVGATDANDQHAEFSNYGGYISVVAPGVDILSTLPRSNVDPPYNWWDGTSMAAPQVSALAGLIWSIRPDLGAADVRTIIERTAVDLGDPGKDPFHGHGRIDAYEALRLAQQYVPPGLQPVANLPILMND